MRDYLKTQSFASDIRIVGIRDGRITGNFEVTIVELNNQLIHSNRRGQGLPNSSHACNVIAIKIEDALESLES